MLEDGTYDVFIVDATAGTDEATWALDLTILAGDHKGELVTVHADGLQGDEFDLLGMPGTLTVANGAPSFVVDS